MISNAGRKIKIKKIKSPHIFESKTFSHTFPFLLSPKKIKLVQYSSGYNDLIPGATVMKLGVLK